MGTKAGIQLVRRRIGSQLQLAREAKRLAREAVGAMPGAPSNTMLYRIENGKAPIRPGTVLVLARIYEMSRETTDALLELAESIVGRGDELTGVSEALGWYADLEGSATSVLSYQTNVIDGLLQTEDYARAVIESGTSDPVAIANRVQLRRERQQTLLAPDSGVKVTIVLAEAALRLTVGNPTIMKGQIQHLNQLSEHVTIHYRPYSAGPHRALVGPYTILDFADPEDPSVIYIETHIGTRFVAKPTQVEDYRGLFTGLVSQSVPIERFRK